MSAVAEVTVTTQPTGPEAVPGERAVFIDLSSIIHPIWHMSQSDPDPNHASIQTVAKVRALASGNPHVAICCDSGRSFRAEIDDTYKANRPESDAMLQHQVTLARETLAGDGFPVWSVKGFEADDLIATGVRLACEAGYGALVISGDKDLLQLVTPIVSAKSLKDGSIIDPEAVAAKFGVRPDQMRDYLSLVGDTADNVRGAKGIGPKGAVRLLLKFDSLDNLYAQISEKGVAALDLKPAEAASLEEFAPRYPTVRSLIALRDDAPVPFSEILKERVPKDAQLEETMEAAPETIDVEVVKAAPLAVREAQTAEIIAAPAEWERQLEPRSMAEARQLAADMHASRLFSAYGSPAAVLSTVLAGRELGIQAMASLRAFHVIEGKPSLSADAIRALILRSGKAKFFRCTERTTERATFETQRGGDPPLTLSYTMAEATASGRVKAGGGYAKDPADLLVARASAKLARLVYPDVVHGMYAQEELEEGNARG